MKKNVGTSDRLMRAVGGASLLVCSFFAPLALPIRIAIFGVMGAYLLMTALLGSCAGYALIGKGTCGARARP